MNNSERRKLLYDIIFGTDTKFGKLFDVILISLILASYLLLMAGSVKAIDTNGAGVLFAGSFLYGITNGLSFGEAGKLACACSSKLVTQFGARLSKDQIQEVYARMH